MSLKMTKTTCPYCGIMNTFIISSEGLRDLKIYHVKNKNVRDFCMEPTVNTITLVTGVCVPCQKSMI